MGQVNDQFLAISEALGFRSFDVSVIGFQETAASEAKLDFHEWGQLSFQTANARKIINQLHHMFVSMREIWKHFYSFL